MSNCKLCKSRAANQTGSHIIPYGIIKKIDSDDEKISREKYLGFVISSIEIDYYFGRGIKPERIEELFGELNEKEISEKARSPFVIDNILCTICEKKLGEVESIYFQYQQKNQEKKHFKGVIPILFWTSILWRISISKMTSIGITKRQKKRLRKFICNYLNSDTIAKNYNPLKYSSDFKYFVFRCPNYEGPQISVINPNLNQPNTILVGEYALVFYFHGKRGKGNPTFFGLEKSLTQASYSNQFSEKTNIIKKDDLLKINQNIMNFTVKQKIKGFEKLIDIVALKLFRCRFDDKLKSEVFFEMSKIESSSGQRFSSSHFSEAFCRVLIKYGIILPG